MCGRWRMPRRWIWSTAVILEIGVSVVMEAAAVVLVAVNAVGAVGCGDCNSSGGSCIGGVDVGLEEAIRNTFEIPSLSLRS